VATIKGTNYSDSLYGGAEADSIFGYNGNDTLKGGGGADRLDGGNGIDTIFYGDSTVGVSVSRPAVSQHLKILEAGLVADHPEGTRRVYYIDPHGLGALRGWLDRFWDQALSAFQAEVESASNRKKDGDR
jgi:Ca2+-binding RTX toxin-like protein